MKHTIPTAAEFWKFVDKMEEVEGQAKRLNMPETAVALNNAKRRAAFERSEQLGRELKEQVATRHKAKKP